MSAQMLIVAAAAVCMFVCLCKAMSLVDRPCPVRPVPPRRPARPAAPIVYVDPGPIDPDAPWRDPQGVA